MREQSNSNRHGRESVIPWNRLTEILSELIGMKTLNVSFDDGKSLFYLS